MVAQKRRQRHQETGRAEAALQAVRLAERSLQWVQLACRTGEGFNGLEFVSVGLDGKHDASADSLTVEQNRARTTDAVLAADVGAGEPELLADEIAQQQARFDFALMANAVDGEVDGNSAAHRTDGL